MSGDAVADAARILTEDLGTLRAAASCDDSRIAVLGVGERVARQVERIQIELIADLDREGVFAARGYRSTVHAVADLLGWDTAVARRRIRVAEHVVARVGLDGQHLPARLPATAALFATGEASVRHVEVIAEALHTPGARRLEPEVWDGAEAALAEQAQTCRPAELAGFATQLIDALDQDGPEPHEEPEQVNELHLSPHTGRIRGELDGITREALATALDALSAPRDAHDHRGAARRRADALGEICQRALDTGDLPERGGTRPQISVVITLAELERRATAACLHFDSKPLPADLRQLACDARVIPVMLDGTGQPVDVGRATSTIPDGMRRAITARDRGCAFPGCDRPPSWCDVHHMVPWEQMGDTSVANCVMVCRVHHRVLHRGSGWTVRIRDGVLEFIPPEWIDPERKPRRRPVAAPRIRARAEEAVRPKIDSCKALRV